MKMRERSCASLLAVVDDDVMLFLCSHLASSGFVFYFNKGLCVRYDPLKRGISSTSNMPIFGSSPTFYEGIRTKTSF
jgi:hypothetical protein